MKRAAFLLPSILLAASVMLAPVSKAAGMIVVDPITPVPHMPITPTIVPIHPVHPVTPGPGHAPTLRGSVSFGLRLQSADVKVDITDNVAKTYVTQTFINDTDQNVAGTYLFPLPEDTTFSSFSLMIDGKPVEGKILEANAARQEYETIVRRMVDPGLLEYADYKTVRARIFPIPAHGTKKVELEYTQLLKAENGMIKYRFPLKTEGAEEAEELKVGVKLNSKQGVRTIWSPSHTIATNRTDDHHAKIQFDAKNTAPDKDFFLYYSLSDKDLAANLITNKSTGEDGYYLLTLAPPVEAKAVSAKDIVLVADTSGSMNGDRLEQSKKALKYIIGALGANDRFSIVQFNTDVDSFKPALVQATPENKKAAETFIDDLEARGGTNIGDGLKTALTMLDSAEDKTRPGFLVLATDGEPTVGETTVPGLLKTANSKRDIRVFDFGVGYDVNTRLLDKLAEAHHGTSQYVEPSESLEVSLGDFYQKIQKPVLTDVKIAYDGVEAKDTYPREVKDIFAGSQVLLLGRYKNGGEGTVKLTGNLNGVQKAYTFPVKFASQEADNTYLPRMWAMRRIAHLTDVAKDNGDTKEVVDEIIALSKKYGIISAYTSFLVTDPAENARLRAGAIGFAPGAFNGPAPAGLPATRMDSFVSNASSTVFGDEGSMDRGVALPHAAFVNSKKPFKLAAEPVNMGKSLGAHQHYTHSAGGSAGGLMPPPPMPTLSFYSAPREVQIVDAATVVRDLRSAPQTGEAAVKLAKKQSELKQEVAMSDNEKAGVKVVEGKTFIMKNGYWVDSAYEEKTSPKLTEVTFGTDAYFNLIKTPGISKFLSVGKQVIFVFGDKAYKINFHETT